MPYFETERPISVTTRDLYGLEAFFNRSIDVLDVNDIGEALMRVLGVDILGRGFEMPVDIDLLLKLLMILYLLHRIQKIANQSWMDLERRSIFALLSMIPLSWSVGLGLWYRLFIDLSVYKGAPFLGRLLKKETLIFVFYFVDSSMEVTGCDPFLSNKRYIVPLLLDWILLLKLAILLFVDRLASLSFSDWMDLTDLLSLCSSILPF